MACKYKYNDKWYTKEELIEVLASPTIPTKSKLQFATTYISDKFVLDSKNYVRDNETNKYTNKDTKAELESVTSFIPNFQVRPIKTNFDAAKVAADNIWKDIPHTTKLTPKEFQHLGELTYDEYVALKEHNFAKFIARAEIYHLKFHREFSDDPESIVQMRNLMTAYNISDGEVAWLNPATIKEILQTRTGTDYWSPKRVDKIVTEVTVASSILGLAGRIDLMIDHGDNVVSLYDIKTGYGISKEWENYLFKYGDTMGKAIWDNPLNRAKLQIMLYALILKSQNPDLMFRDLKVLHIPSELDKDNDSLRNEVDPVPFLEIIEKFLKAEHPSKYEDLLKASPKIFKPDEYSTVTTKSVRVNSVGQDPAMILKLKILELQKLIMYDKNIVEKVIKGDKVSSNRTQKIGELMSEIIELKKDKSMSLASWDTDMKWMDTWVGSASYSTNPYVQLYYKMLTEAKQRVRNDYEPWRRKFDKLMENALSEIGINPKPVTKLIGGPNTKVLMDKFIKIDEHNNERFVTDTKKEDQVEWNALGPAQQELLRFILNSNDQFFVDEMAPNGKAMANKVVTTRKTSRGSKAVTNLGLYNKEISPVGSKRKGTTFKWERGFLPKMAPKLSDVIQQHKLLSKEVAIFLWNRYATNFFEASFDRWNSTLEAIPFKGLGENGISESRNYSHDLEYLVDGFVKQNFYKQHLDEVYAFGASMQIYLKLKEASADNIIFKNTIEWFEDSLDLHILGKKDNRNEWVARNLKINSSTGYHNFNFTKFLRSLKGFFVAPTMWLKPLTGLPNGVFASLVTLKEGVKNSLFMKGDHSNFGIKDIQEGFGVAIGMQSDGMVGKLRSNKAFLLMEKFGYMPDNYDWFTRPNEMLTARNKLFTSKTMMFFHTLPEEVVATAIFVAQLKAMKLADGSSMWDHYVTKDVEDATIVEWDGTVRGKRNISNLKDLPQYEDVLGLEIEEINSIKFLYEKLHGGYRLDERVRAEYYILGEMFLQFKKFLPGVLKNIGASRGWRQTQGFFREEEENGNKVLKWTPQVVEGRWRLLAGLMLNYIGLKRKLRPEGDKGNKLMQFLGYQQNESYEWDSLSDAQKEDVKDFVFTWMVFIAMFLGFSFAWDRDEEDTIAKIYKRIMNDMAISTNPMEILRNVTALPVSWDKTRKLTGATVDLSLSIFLDAAGYDDQALTREGQYKGWKEFQRNTPFLASLHSWYKGLEESEFLESTFSNRLK